MAQTVADPQTNQSQGNDESQVAQKVYGALKDAPVSDDVRAQAWDAFTKAATPQDFKKTFDPIKSLPDSVKGILWDFKKPSWRNQQGDLPPGAPMPAEKPAAQEQPWYNRAIVPLDKLVAGPEKSQPWYEQFGRGAAQGAGESAAGLTSPKNLAIMGVMGGANLIPGVGEVVDAGASLLLGEEQVREMWHSFPEIKKAYEANDWGKLGNLVGKDAASAFVSYKSGKRGVDKLKGKFGEGSIPDTTPAGSNRTSPPPPGAPPTYPLVEAGTQKALGQGQPQTGPFNMPGQPEQPAAPQSGLPAGPSSPQGIPGGQEPLQLPPASQIQLPGTPTPIPMGGAPQRPSGLLIEQGGPKGTPPPPGAGVRPASAEYTPPEPRAGGTPASRQITDGSGPMTYEVYLEHAKTLPKEQLAKNVQQMIAAMAERAETIPKAKRAEFIKAAKGYIKPFEDILNSHEDVKGPASEPASEPDAGKSPEPKAATSPKKAEPKVKAETPKKEPKESNESESNIGPADPEMSSRVKNQLDSAKAKGIKNLSLLSNAGAERNRWRLALMPI